MKIQMLTDCLSTIDGFVVEKFYKGQIYDLREFIATNLINRKMAKYITEFLTDDEIEKQGKN